MPQPATGIEISNSAAYRQKMLALLGDRGPLDVLAATPDVLARLAAPHPASVMQSRPFADRWTWTPNEIIGHLLDGEWVYGYRVRLILCEERPTILGMDQEKWVAGQRHNEREPAELIADFRALRQRNVAAWRRMSAADLKRVGVHNERGEEPLGLMLKMNAGHDLSHIDQITRYLAAITRK